VIRRPCVALAPLALWALALPGCSGSSAPDSNDIPPGSAGASGGARSSAAGGGGSVTRGGAGNPSVSLPPQIARYLRASSPRLVLEIDATRGLAPYPESSTYLTAWLGSVVDKPDGVVFESDETLEPVGSTFEWTFAALNTLAEAHARDDASGPPRIHVLALDGRYVEEGTAGTILGLAWDNRFVALFQDAIRERCQGGLTGALEQDVCKIAERNVWAHELGHTLGLVDNGVPMVTEHRDPAHGQHDVREGCLMYWAYDGPQVFDTLLARFGSQKQDLDLCAESQQDIEAAK
jgi:hypothetical protein